MNLILSEEFKYPFHGSLLVFCAGRLLYAWGSFYFESHYQVLLFWIWFYLVDSDTHLPGFEALSLLIPFSGFLIRVLYWLIIICLRKFLSWNFDFNFNSLFCFLWIWFYLINSETLWPGFQALSLSLSLPFSGFLIWVLFWWVIICFRKFLS